MFTISGKQRFGSVWHDGRCIAQFKKGVAHVDNPEDAKYLEGLGYAVEWPQNAQEPPPSDPDGITPPADDPAPDGAPSEPEGDSPTPEPEEVPKMGVNSRRGRRAQ